MSDLSRRLEKLSVGRQGLSATKRIDEMMAVVSPPGNEAPHAGVQHGAHNTDYQTSGARQQLHRRDSRELKAPIHERTVHIRYGGNQKVEAKRLKHSQKRWFAVKSGHKRSRHAASGRGEEAHQIGR